MSTKLESLESTINELQVRITKLEEQLAKPKVEPKEMTDSDARRILNGDLSDKKHKEAAEVLGLTYGQVYSCRGEYTFKHIHKELKASGFKNPWVK